MKRWQRTDARQLVVVRPTTGDFPHTRRRSLRLACCSCTSCCFTFLLAGIGGLAGLVTGLQRATQSSTDIINPLAALAVGFVRVVIFLVAYALAGILIGAAIGFGVDTIIGVW